MKRNRSHTIILFIAGILLASCASRQPTAMRPAVEQGGASTQFVSPVVPLATYRNEGDGEQPPYQLTYNLAVWEEREGEPFRKPLSHKQIPGCTIELDSNGTEQDTETTIQLGGRTWWFYEYPLVSRDVFHISYYLKEGDANYGFDVFVLYTESLEVIGECKSAAEEVLASLRPQYQ